MNYAEKYTYLKEAVSYNKHQIVIDDTTLLVNCDFESHNSKILPGEDHYNCHFHPVHFSDQYNYQNSTGILSEILDVHDSEVLENKQFKYHIFKPAGVEKSSEIILLFHGFNEKHWHKYLPWAKRLLEQTGKTVVLFPIAFHMNRAPHEWSDRRFMFEVSEQRRRMFPNIIACTLSNVAISSRLQANPQRFFWSGMQTFHDVIQLVEQIRSGDHPEIRAEATIDIFAYSIGCLLSQILLMNNPRGYFTDTKVCLFCGGSVFNRTSPVSKLILDSEANVALYSFAIEHLESHLKHDLRLCHYLSPEHPEGLDFLSMLNYKTMRLTREAKFMSLSKQMMAITLEKDSVMPAYEIMNTLKGVARNIPIAVHNFDFPYTYRHEDPFPVSCASQNMVNESFEEVFDLVGSFLGKR